MSPNKLPVIIQGGMGVAVSGWRLARAVSTEGQLGVVSGTAMDLVLARRLQLGDPDGDLRRALSAFPYQEMVERVLDRYFIDGGKSADDTFISIPMLGANPSNKRLELIVVANFVEVYLAKENHNGIVGTNFLEKIQLPTLASLFGAMLADVDYVLMGAGIPRHIPEALDRMASGLSVKLPLNIEGANSDDDFCIRFDPKAFSNGRVLTLKRPQFLAIVASSTLATMLARKSKGKVDGFVVEGPTAGGHNASPRGAMKKNTRGEPVYGKRDAVELSVFRELGIPFWLAGSYGTPERVEQALQSGATGVQVGTAFAFCEESGLDESIKKKALAMSRDGTTDVFTDPVASPTGFPFKVLGLPGSMSEASEYQQRERVCDLGYLRHGFRKPDGTIGWRCPGDNVQAFIHKGGIVEDTIGRKCVCNGLLANIGLAQVQKGRGAEKVLVTCGNEVSDIAKFLPDSHAASYSAKQTLDYLLSATKREDQVATVC